MVLSGGWLVATLIVLAVWLGLLCWTLLKQLSATGPVGRNRVSIAGLICSIVAVASLFALHITWISAGFSQQLGTITIRVLAILLFWPTLAGLAFCVAGSGKARWFGFASCLATGIWWCLLWMSSAISMGAPLARHPVEYLIPDGYVGWVTITHGVNAPPTEVKSGKYIYRIASTGKLATSSKIEDGWAKDEYAYYRTDGSLTPLPETEWGKGGMIWGNVVESDQQINGSQSPQISENFFVGTEAQYNRDVNTQQLGNH